MACKRCGKNSVALYPRELFVDGILRDIVDTCDDCWSDFVRGIEWWRCQFRALLDAGVARAEANRQLIARMNSGERPPTGKRPGPDVTHYHRNEEKRLTKRRDGILAKHGVKWRALRSGTPRDLARVFADHACCHAEDRGWICSLQPSHKGPHEAWATEPLELCHEWKNR